MKTLLTLILIAFTITVSAQVNRGADGVYYPPEEVTQQEYMNMGDHHLIKATRQFNTALVLSILGGALTVIGNDMYQKPDHNGIYVNNDPNKHSPAGTAIMYAGYGSLTLGFIYGISAAQQFGKAGKAYQKGRALQPSISNNGIGLTYRINNK